MSFLNAVAKLQLASLPQPSPSNPAPFINIVSNFGEVQAKRVPLTSNVIEMTGKDVNVSGLNLKQLGIDMSKSIGIQVLCHHHIPLQSGNFQQVAPY